MKILNFKIFGIKFGGLILLALGLFISFKILQLYWRIISKRNELESLGLASEKVIFIKDIANPALKRQVIKRELKVHKNKNSIVFYKYNSNYGLEDFNNIKDKLETIYNIKIDTITKEKPFLFWNQAIIKIHFNSFKTYSIEELPKLKRGEMFAGFNVLNEPCILDTINDFENLIIILGGKGSGKSILLRTLIYSFLNSFTTQEHKFVLVDFKAGNDFHDLLEEFNGELINPTKISGLKRIVEILEINKRDFEQFSDVISQKKLGITHFDKSKEFGLSAPQKYFFVFDEAKQYLSETKEVKLSKEPSDDELEEFEKYKLKKRLASLVNNFSDTNRLSGSVMTISTQDSRSTSYSFAFHNFKTMFLGQQNQVQSQALTGTNIATDKDLRFGKFIAIANGTVQKIQTPLFIELKK